MSGFWYRNIYRTLLYTTSNGLDSIAARDVYTLPLYYICMYQCMRSYNIANIILDFNNRYNCTRNFFPDGDAIACATSDCSTAVLAQYANMPRRVYSQFTHAKRALDIHATALHCAHETLRKHILFPGFQAFCSILLCFVCALLGIVSLSNRMNVSYF